jgi:CRP-like cAMP-binding protein
VIFREGDKADKMYVVLSGEVEVHLQGTVIDTLAQGDTFDAFKHGRYTAEAIALRRDVAALLRAMKTLADSE